MTEIYLRLISRKKQIVNNIAIITLLLLASCLTFFLPQLINPQILGAYFENFSGINNLEELISDTGITYISSDIEFHGSTRSVEFIDDFSSILQTTSTDIYGGFNTVSHDLICNLDILFNGTDYTVLLGVNRDRYEEILTINQNETVKMDFTDTEKENDDDTPF